MHSPSRCTSKVNMHPLVQVEFHFGGGPAPGGAVAVVAWALTSVGCSTPVADLLARPRSPFVADLVGVNLLAGVASGADAILLPGKERVVGVSQDGHVEGRAAIASFVPAAVAVHTTEPSGSPRNHLRATVAGIEPRGSLVRLTAHLADGSPVAADLTLAASVDEGIVPGRSVWLVVKAAQVVLYPR